MANYYLNSNGTITKKKKEEKKATNYFMSDNGIITKEKQLVSNDKKWFDTGAFDDGYQFGDISKTIFGTGANVASGVLKGVSDVGFGTGKLIAGGVAQAADLLGQDEWANKVRNRIAGKDEETNKRLKAADIFGNINEATQDASVLGTKGNEVSKSIGQIAGYGAASVVNPVLGSAAMFGSSAGESLGEAYSKENVKNEQAWTKALVGGGISLVTERLFGLFGKSGGIDKQIANKISSKLTKGMSKELARLGVQSTFEATEELLEYAGNQLLDLGIDAVSNGKGAKFHEDWNWEEVGQQMATAAIASGIVGAGTKAIGIKNTQGSNLQEKINNYALQEDIQEGVLPQQENPLEKLQRTNIEQRQQINQQVEQELATRRNGINQELSLPAVSTEGMNLMESASRYNIKPEKQNAVQNLMENRGIESRWDATRFNDNSVNALWTKDANGNRQVIFNPNASLDTIVEEVAVHELTHDILSSKNTALNSQEVLNYVKTLQGYNEARQNLENTYATMYDPNSAEFNSLIDEEVVADVLGRKLGNQEFINQLVNSKPSVAKSIYNWVVNKLNSIVNKGKVRSEKLYWQNIKNNFENAYKQEYKNNETASTKYSIEQNYRGSHQIENAKPITELNVDDITTKIKDIDGYLTNQSESDLKKLKKILNNPNEKVTIYRASPVNELNSGDWVTTDKSYAKNVANNNGGKVYSYEVNANELYYPDNVNDLPSLHRLSSFQYNENKQNNVKYSISNVDNQGRELSKEQQEYFKDSKVRDENGNLEVVYHQTKNDFTEFKNGFSVRGFKNANFFTNQKPKQILKNMLEGYVKIDNPLYLEDTSIQQNIVDNAIKNGYDGIINQNVQGIKGKNEIVTFNSNQFKNIDNTNPTSDPDIRYSKQSKEWDKWNNKTIAPEGTKTKLGDIKLPTKQKVSLPTKSTTEVKTPSKKVLNPIEISRLTKEDASTTPILPETKTTKGDKQSKFIGSLNQSEMLTQESKDIINSANIGEYTGITNEETLQKAKNKLIKEGKSETERWFRNDAKKATATDIAEGFILLNQYQEMVKKADNDVDRYNANQSMVQVAKKLREIGTEAGQTLQAYSILSRMTPEGMVYYAQNELQEAYNEMVKNKSKEWIDKYRDDFELKPEETQFILDTMKEVSTMEDGYDKRVKLAEIQKLMTDKLPPEKGKAIKSWMRISMLFNPKTQVRNVVGNAGIMPVNSFGDLFASYADKLIAKKTGVRTTGRTNIKAILKGMKKGAYEATNDYRKGINTRDMEGNRFEIGEGKSFNDNTTLGKGLNRTDRLLNYVMDAGDRIFSEAAFENSLQNQMKLNNTTEITQDMIDIAHQEALSRTWNDNNEYTKFVLGVRRGLNKIGFGNYGLGDILIPFAKTPANLTKAIVDYSPAGMIKTIVEGNNLRKSLSNGQFTPQMQHKFVQDLGKATAGTMLYVLGAALAKAGITSGESDDDKDTANFLKNTLGVNSYSIKIGNKTFTYDWMQPMAAPLAITANIENKKKENATLYDSVLSSLDTAGNILLEQSFLDSLKTALTNNKGIATGIQEAVMELPSRTIPTLMKQITDMTDGTQRQTFEYNKPLDTAINKVKAKIPVLSKTLAPSVDTMGREIQKYGGKNNIFNVFLNPSNVNTENISESAAEIYRLYQETGDTTIMPRVAPYYINKGEKITLDSKQREKYQKISGNIIESSIKDLLKDSKYKNMSDDDKADIVNDIVNYAYNKAQNEVLGTEISNQYSKVNQYVEDGGKPAEYYLNKEEINYSYNNPEKYSLIKSITTYDKYKDYDKKIEQIKNDYPTTNDKKNAVAKYVNTLSLSVPQKAMLIKSYYKSFKQYDRQIAEYIAKQNLTRKEKETVLKQLGFTIKDGRVYK